jgi:hypothetical protein
VSWRPDHPDPIIETIEMYYVAGVDYELAYVVAAVTEIAILRGELYGRAQG